MFGASKTDDSLWAGIQPGDIGFDAGLGLTGLIIRLGTRSNYGHCWVYHQLLDLDSQGNEIWDTVEAGPSGVLHRVRTRKPNKVVRLWRNEQEQRDILRASENLVGAGYGWGEIVRIVCRILGIKLRRRKDNPRRVICSNHSTQAAVAGRPDLAFYLRYPHYEIWPGEVALTLDAYVWDTEVN
jgi:hypothetical protein